MAGRDRGDPVASSAPTATSPTCPSTPRPRAAAPTTRPRTTESPGREAPLRAPGGPLRRRPRSGSPTLAPARPPPHGRRPHGRRRSATWAGLEVARPGRPGRATASGGRSSACPPRRSTPSCCPRTRSSGSPSRSTDPPPGRPVNGGGNAHLFDPVTGVTEKRPAPRRRRTRTARSPPANVWCGGQVPARRRTRAGGRRQPRLPRLPGPVGAGSGFRGAKWVVTFDPWTETWTRHADMAHGRWYPSLAELPDGRVLILGGWDESGGARTPDGPATCRG